MLGGYIASGKPIAAFMPKPVYWVAFIISTALLTAGSYYLAKWIMKIAYGKHLQHLKEKIKALKAEA